jgi:hypothetical protein
MLSCMHLSIYFHHVKSGSKRRTPHVVGKRHASRKGVIQKRKGTVRWGRG